MGSVMSVPAPWRYRRARADLARVPKRPSPMSAIRSILDDARGVGVRVQELDEHHVWLAYDARDHDHWLAVDAIYEAVHARSMVEGDEAFLSGPGNWMVIHFDYGACGWSPSGSGAAAKPRK